MRAEQLTDKVTHHGEGPIWDARTDRLRWVDMLAGDILTMDPAVGTITWFHVGSVAAAMRPRANGGLVVAVERGFAVADPDAGTVEPFPEVWSDCSVRMNDGACDPQGRFYCGSMAYDKAPGRGALYRLDVDGSVATVLDGVTISNGLAWRADGASAVYIDSPTRRVDRLEFDAATGTFGARRPFVTIDVGDAVPDGLTLDVEGGVWVALWGGRAVHRYDEGGELTEVVELPVQHVSACALDPSGQLYITTSADGGDDDPRAGALFTADAGVAGAPLGAFAG